MATRPLTPEEKRALKALKVIKKTSKPGGVQKTLDGLPSKDKLILASAIKKSTPASRLTKVNKPTKQASPVETKIRNKRTGKLVTIKNNPPRGGLSGLRNIGGGGMNWQNK